jgi:uncharacterized membrane protein YphA (DoxX/SURF4 family)
MFDAMDTLRHGSIAAALGHALAATAGLLLLVGLWTPIVGTATAFAEMLVILSSHEHVRSHFLQCVFSIALAMIGPGVWSADARLFGWKRLEIPPRKS